VRATAERLAAAEGADRFIVTLAALLHDIADRKFHGGDDTVGPRLARELLVQHGVAADVTEHVCEIVATTSFRGAGVPDQARTLEGKVVQDADRLDALGAIGVARAFAYGGWRGRPLYDPEAPPPVQHQTKEAYAAGAASTVHHFYEKLFLLRERMYTPAARALAAERHRFLERFLAEFDAEWRGER
jgi:uncharacterized protein